jgi:hypothetical protein
MSMTGDAFAGASLAFGVGVAIPADRLQKVSNDLRIRRELIRTPHAIGRKCAGHCRCQNRTVGGSPNAIEMCLLKRSELQSGGRY